MGLALSTMILSSIVLSPPSYGRAEILVYEGIPHIRAENPLALAYAQGYITAKQRLFQMDLSRRRAEGRMAEWLGEKAVEEDFKVRTVGLHIAARRSWEGLDSEAKAILHAYADGVNDAVKEMPSLPLEYRRLGVNFSPWEPVDSLALVKGIAWRLSSSVEEEASAYLAILQVGMAKLLDFVRAEPADPISVIDAAREEPPHFSLRSLPSGAGALMRRVLASLPQLGQGKTGSNNFVLAPFKTASGKPIVANDPHLSLEAPPIWHLVHLKCPEFELAGATFPGIPGIIIGTNFHLAWGVTNTGFDAADLFTFRTTGDGKAYFYRGGAVPFKVRVEEVKVRGGKAARREVYETHVGPVIARLGKLVAAVKWVGALPTRELSAFLKLYRSKTVFEAERALRDFACPAQNFVVADLDGNIFYRPNGLVPIRMGTPFLPLNGESGEFDWRGFIPWEEMPQIVNPRSGVIVTANNRPISKFRYYLAFTYDLGFRARRLWELLHLAGRPVDLTYAMTAQCDVYSKVAERIWPFLKGALERRKSELSTLERRAWEVLSQWDKFATTNSTGSAIFHAWLRFALQKTFLDDLPGDLGRQLVGYENVSVRTLIAAFEGKTKLNWFDNKRTPQEESGEDIAVSAFKEAVKWLTKKLGPDPEKWAWGRIHRVRISHPLIPEISYEPRPAPGGAFTVNPGGFSAFGEDFDFGGGASVRLVVELTSPRPKVYVCLPGGQESNPRSPHFSDQYPFWLKGAFLQMELNWEKLKMLPARFRRATVPRPALLAPR